MGLRDNMSKMLQQNPNVKRVSERGITYTTDFKNKFIDEYLAGKFPRQIYIDNGFDVDVIGMKRIEQSSYRWKKAFEKDGTLFLMDSRKTPFWSTP